MKTVQINDGGKKKVEKLSLKAEQRDGIEYEFTTVLDITHGDNYAIATKDRTGLFIQPEKITKQTGIKLSQWLSSGSADATINGNQILELEALMIEAGIDIEKYCTKRKLNSLQDVRQQVFEETCNSIKRIIEQKAKSNQESGKHLQHEQDALLEADYQKALAAIQNAQSANDLKYPADYFKGGKYEQ